MVTLDRQEIGQNSDLSASAELQKDGLNVFSVISLDDLLDANELIDSSSIEAIRDYRNIYQGKNV